MEVSTENATFQSTEELLWNSTNLELEMMVLTITRPLSVDGTSVGRRGAKKHGQFPWNLTI